MEKPFSVPTEFDLMHRRLVNDKLVEHDRKLEIATGRLTRLVQLGLELGSGSTWRLVERCCRAGRDLLFAERAVVVLQDADGQTLRVSMACGSEQQVVEQTYPTSAWNSALGVLDEPPRVLRCFGPDARDLLLPYPPKQSFLGTTVVSPSRKYGWLLYFVDKLGAAGSATKTKAWPHC